MKRKYIIPETTVYNLKPFMNTDMVDTSRLNTNLGDLRFDENGNLIDENGNLIDEYGNLIDPN